MCIRDRYLLFAEVLKDNLNKLDDLRYDMKYGISFERTVCFENPIEIFDYVQAKSKELIRKNDILCVILNKALKEALGERGTPGNAEYIIYVCLLYTSQSPQSESDILNM